MPVVIPFRLPHGQTFRSRPVPPGVSALARNLARTGICLYLTPWLWWLDYLSEDNSSLWDKDDPRWTARTDRRTPDGR